MTGCLLETNDGFFQALAEEKDSSESLRRQVAALKQELCDCATEASTKLKECQKVCM